MDTITLDRASAVTERSARGRILAPAERAAVIRNLETAVLVNAMHAPDAQWKALELQVAREADAELKEQEALRQAQGDSSPNSESEIGQ